MRVQLSKGDIHLELDPGAGGSVSSLRHRDLDVLRPAPPRSGPAYDPLQYAAFPMLPFVGRIHNGHFGVNGEDVKLHPNLAPEPHAIHGFGWQTTWKINAQSQDTIELVHHHTPDAWPWAYLASQIFELTPQGLHVRLSVKNDSAAPMPAGLGWHPYFNREGARLSLPTTHEWVPDSETGDNRPVKISSNADLSTPRMVESLKLDTTFSVSEPVIEMAWSKHSVRLISDHIFGHATIYVPPRQDYFCAEPITHAPNAVNSALSEEITGLKWLEPGETLSGAVQLVVER